MKKLASGVCGALIAVGISNLGAGAAHAADGADFGLLGLLFKAPGPAAATPAAKAAAEPEAYPQAEKPRPARAAAASHGGSSTYRSLIEKHASANGVPYKLADAVVQVESRYNARVVHAGNFGLMQIRPQTARGVGFSGSPSGLLDPDTNLRYGVKYLAVAYRQAGGNTCSALRYYQSGIGAHGMSGANRAYCRKAQAFMASN